MDKCIFNELIGKQISSITFVQDYLQLCFDGPSLNIYNPINVKTKNKKISSWENGFRDLLCEQISKCVKNIYFESKKHLKIALTDTSEIFISLKEKDYIGPEALNFYGGKGIDIVVI